MKSLKDPFNRVAEWDYFGIFELELIAVKDRIEAFLWSSVKQYSLN